MMIPPIRKPLRTKKRFTPSGYQNPDEEALKKGVI
jgi:hypothetical protein